MAKDLQDNAYRLLERFLKRYFLEGLLVLLVSLAVVSSMISWSRAERAIDDAKEAKANSAAQANLIEQLSDDVATYRFQQSLTHSELRARGFELTPLEKTDE